MTNSIEWDYGRTKVLPEDIIEAIAAKAPPEWWMAVSARLADLVVEVFCERHGAWEPEDTDCAGGVCRFRMTDTHPDAASLLAPVVALIG